MENLIEELQAQLAKLDSKFKTLEDVEYYAEGGHKPKDVFWAGESYGETWGKMEIIEMVIKRLKEFSNG